MNKVAPVFDRDSRINFSPYIKQQMQHQSILLVAVVFLVCSSEMPVDSNIIRDLDGRPSSSNVIEETWPQLKRFQRAIRFRGWKKHHHKQCRVVNYHSDSQIGHQATCPFDWVVDTDSTRIPENIFEQICQKCRSCGPHYRCTQLKVHYDVYYQDTSETSQLQVRAGCVCLPQNLGSSASILDL